MGTTGKIAFRSMFALLAFTIMPLHGGAAAKYYPSIEIIGETNRSALSYKSGEKMVFSFKLNDTKTIPEQCFLRYMRRGDDGKTFRGKAPAAQGLTVTTSLKKPGFVYIEVTLTDANGKPLLRGAKKNNRIAYFAGAAVEPEKLSDCGEPADLDAFWAKQKQRLAAVPFLKETKCKLVRTVPTGKVYELTIPCAGPRPATGYLIVPNNAKEKSLAARIDFYGYGASAQRIPGMVVPGHLVLKLNAHGQKLGQTPEYYKEFFASIKSGKYNYAFDPEQNKDPENCFFNGMVMRALRAMEYLKSRPEWNGKDLIASGGSQGGLQTMWAAALDPDVTLAMPSVTWCCDMAGTAKAKRLHGGWRIQYVPQLDYYDPVFMAKRIKNAEVNITRAGLGDYTCPPSGLAICYRNLATAKKSIRWVQGSDHGFIPSKSEVVVWKNEKK